MGAGKEGMVSCESGLSDMSGALMGRGAGWSSCSMAKVAKIQSSKVTNAPMPAIYLI